MLRAVTPTSDLTRLPELEVVDRVIAEVERSCHASEGWRHDLTLTSMLATQLVAVGWERRRAVLLIGAVARRWEARRAFLQGVARLAKRMPLGEAQAKARRRWTPTLQLAHDEVRALIHPEETP